MGIAVDQNKNVSYDANSFNLIDSRPSHNPVMQKVYELDIYSLFRRVNPKGTSDDNPLIYALKSINGYRIDEENILLFMPSFYAVLNKIKPYCQADCVVPMPSSSKISSMFARRVSRHFGGSFENEWLSKKWNREVSKQIDNIIKNGNLNHSELRDLKKANSSLNRSLSSIFSMKNIDSNLRKHFDPFKLNKSAQIPAGKSVLLVDDLLSTGASFLSAKRLLESQGVTDIKYLCLFSSTGPYDRV